MLWTNLQLFNNVHDVTGDACKNPWFGNVFSNLVEYLSLAEFCFVNFLLFFPLCHNIFSKVKNA